MSEGVILCFILAISVLLWLPFLNTPFYSDQGIYAYVAQRWRRGKLPYRDTLEGKPIGIFLIYAFIQRSFGKSPKALMVFLSFYSTTGVFLIYIMTKYLFGKEIAFFSSFFYSLYILNPKIQGYVPYPENFAIPFIVLNLYTFLIGVNENLSAFYFFSGIFGSFAFLFKQTFLIFLPFYLGTMIIFSNNPFEVLFVFILGFVIPQIVVIIYFFLKGGLYHYLNSVFWLQFFRYQMPFKKNVSLKSSRFDRKWNNCLKPIFLEINPLLFLSIFSIIHLFLEPLTSKHLIFLLWSLLSIYLPFWRWPYIPKHYFIPIIPALSILSGVGANNLVKLSLSSPIFSIPLLGIILLGFWVVKNSYKVYLPMAPFEREKLIFPNSIVLIETPAIKPLSEYIKKTTKETDKIIETGYSAEVLYLAERDSPWISCRYEFPFSWKDKNPKLALEGMRALKDNPPRLILLFPTALKGEALFDIKAFEEHTGVPYILEKVIRNVQIFRALTLNREAVKYFKNGELLLKLKKKEKWKRAIALFKKVIDLDPECAKAYTYLSLCYLKTNMFEKAVFYLDKAIKLRSYADNLSYEYNLLARVYSAQKKYKQSKEAREKAKQYKKIFREATLLFPFSAFYYTVEQLRNYIKIGVNKVLIYGTGSAGINLAKAMEKMGFDVIGFLDSNKELWGRKIFLEKKIFGFDELEYLNYDKIFVASQFFPEIQRILKKLNLLDKSVLPFTYF
jgi:tetratricopeptide (TPR) repeat protein